MPATRRPLRPGEQFFGGRGILIPFAKTSEGSTVPTSSPPKPGAISKATPPKPTKRKKPKITGKIYGLYRSCSNWEAGGVLFEETPWQWIESADDAMRNAQESASAAQACINSDVSYIESTPSLIFSSGYSWLVMAFQFPMFDGESFSDASQRIEQGIRKFANEDYERAVDRLERLLIYFGGAHIEPISEVEKTYTERPAEMRESLEELLDLLH